MRSGGETLPKTHLPTIAGIYSYWQLALGFCSHSQLTTFLGLTLATDNFPR
jgi:hypothetical protein